jgi:eukaryotic-like serine/threonine-protein kinase
VALPQPSRLYGGRFQLEGEAGRGGMATIYRARDLLTGEQVAVKVLRGDAGLYGDRFRQEAALLADLRHPAIVKYIDHGVTAAGEHFLAMEWLEGETLEQRLRRGPLGVLATMRLGSRVLDALALAHDKGVVHRDLKPSNLFLAGGSLDELKLLDFGIARRLLDIRRLTRTGSTLGTPIYMSPEQARGDRVLDGRSDIFSLATMLVECLTGTPPFAADTPLAVMVKICLEPLDVRAACGPAPAPLVDLLSLMLAKRPDQRPPRADALAQQLAKMADRLAALGSFDDAKPSELPATARPNLTIEQRILCAIVLLPPSADVTVDRIVDGIDTAVVAALDPFGGRIDRFLGGAMLITLPGRGTPTDQAAHAARCALKLQALLPGAVLGIGTGRATVGDDLPVGAVIDRATLLLQGQEPGEIVVDLATGALLESAFEISWGSGSGRLLAERPHAETAPMLHGKELPCIGRERELATLVGIFEECLAEPVARAVLVTGPAGGGKSRVRREFLARAHSRGQPFHLLLGRGDSIRAGAPFGLLGPALRAAARLTGNEPMVEQRARFAFHVARHLPATVVKRVVGFLGEIAAIPFPDDDLPALRSAREDARVMADQLLVAWLDWIEAECRHGPVMLILEDLQWGDAPSVDFVDAALRTLHDLPLMVVALSRPEGEERFTGLWAGRALQHVSLPPLTAKSCQKLIHNLVGELDRHKVAWIIERADGNAFYLEELVRAVAGGGDTQTLNSLPDTVLGMLQSRFDTLGVYVRRVLRAASVFGQTFHADGVAALVGDGASVLAAIEVLQARDVVAGRPGSADREFVFRHALLRDAAYEMLTDDDRRRAHGLAGDFLERRGERNAIVLVEHYERGGLAARAAKHCGKAAAQALEANDLRSAIERVATGVRNGAGGETLGTMRVVEAQARFWCGEFADGEAAAREATGLSRGPTRLHALSELVAALGQQGRYAEIESALDEGRAWPESSEHLPAWHAVLLRAAAYLPSGGRIERTRVLIAEVERAAPVGDPALEGQLHKARGLLALGTAQPAAAALHFRQAIPAFEAAADLRGTLEARCNVAAALGGMGQLEETERHLRDLLAIADRMDLPPLRVNLLQNLGSVRADLGALEEGQALVERGLAAAREQGDPRTEGYCQQILAAIATRAGRLEAAEVHARAAVASAVTSVQPFAVATLAEALLGQGRVLEALDQAREANRLLEAQGYVEDGEALVRLCLVECLLAGGDTAAARQAAVPAYRRLLERAATIDEPQWRASFLEALPDHRRTVELAEALGVTSDGAPLVPPAP